MLEPPKPDRPAFGESLGVDVPTRYGTDTHTLFNYLMAGDSATTPLLLGMRPATIWLCRALALLLVLLSQKGSGLDQRTRLQIELAAGIALLIGGLLGRPTSRLWDRLYLLVGGLMMIGNALMTQPDDR